MDERIQVRLEGRPVGWLRDAVSDGATVSGEWESAHIVDPTWVRRDLEVQALLARALSFDGRRARFRLVGQGSG